MPRKKKKRKFCPKCGKELKQKDIYCISCGYSFEKRKKKLKLKNLIIIIIIVIVIWIAIRLLTKQPIIPRLPISTVKNLTRG